MNGSSSNVEHIALMNIHPVQQLFRARILNRLFESLQRHAGLQSQCNLSAGLGAQRIPAFGLSARLADLVRLLIVGMDLHRQLVAGKKKLYQQWKAIAETRGLPDQIAAVLLREFAKCAPCQRPVGYPVVSPSQPGLADRLLHSPGVNRTKIANTPRALVEDGHQQEWIKFRHQPTRWRRICACAPVRAPGSRLKLHTKPGCGLACRSLHPEPQPRALRARVFAPHRMPSSSRRARSNG